MQRIMENIPPVTRDPMPRLQIALQEILRCQVRPQLRISPDAFDKVMTGGQSRIERRKARLVDVQSRKKAKRGKSKANIPQYPVSAELKEMTGGVFESPYLLSHSLSANLEDLDARDMYVWTIL